MLKNKKKLWWLNLLIKKEIVKKYSIDAKQEAILELFLKKLREYNLHTNLVGKSTLKNPWVSHILDSLQILPHLKSKDLHILDMGTGAGFPGAVLSIAGYKNVTLVDSNGKKINFLKLTKKELLLSFNVILGRIESLSNFKYDIITTRALASLDKLFSYSQRFIKKNTVMIFLKGKTVNEEIKEAQKKWNFYFSKSQSISHSDGSVLLVKNLKKK